MLRELPDVGLERIGQAFAVAERVLRIAYISSSPSDYTPRNHFFIPLALKLKSSDGRCDDNINVDETDPYDAEEVLLGIFKSLREPGTKTATDVDFSAVPPIAVYHPVASSRRAITKACFTLAREFILAHTK